LESTHNCHHCGKSFLRLKRHFCPRYGQRGGRVGLRTIDQSFFKETQRSGIGIVIDYTHTVEGDQVYDDIYEFLTYIHVPLKKLLEENLEFWCWIDVVYRQYTELEDLKTGEKKYRYFSTNSITIRHKNSIEGVIHYITSNLLAQLEIIQMDRVTR